MTSAPGSYDVPAELGPRLRALRQRKGVGVRELARRLDLSPSAISQIETGKIQPSVRTLYALASEFAVTVDEVLFGEATPAPPASAAGVVPGSAPSQGPGVGVGVGRVGRRPTIKLESGVTWERLMTWADEDLEFIEATYEPGGASGPADTLVRHSGYEFGWVLSGTLHVVVGFEEFTLETGDSITFPSTTPHRLSNAGSEPARAIWVVRGRHGTVHLGEGS